MGHVPKMEISNKAVSTEISAVLVASNTIPSPNSAYNVGENYADKLNIDQALFRNEFLTMLTVSKRKKPF